MSSKSTKNLNLHAWKKTDAFMMDEFNENFDAIDKAVGGKAEQDALDTLTGQVAAKAEQTALDALSGRVDKKAEQTALDAEIAAREAALAALAGQLGELDAARLRFKFDSYTGNGRSGTTNPTRLEFDFKPLMVIIASASPIYGGRPWLRGVTRATSAQLETGQVKSATLTWEDRAVEWVNYTNSDTAEFRLNSNNATYIYLAIGIAD